MTDETARSKGDMVSAAAILQGVRQSVADVLSIPVTDVLEDSVLTDLGADSFRILDLTCHIESRFRIQFPLSFGLAGEQSVATIARAVAAELGARRNTPPRAQGGTQRLIWM